MKKSIILLSFIIASTLNAEHDHHGHDHHDHDHDHGHSHSHENSFPAEDSSEDNYISTGIAFGYKYIPKSINYTKYVTETAQEEPGHEGHGHAEHYDLVPAKNIDKNIFSLKLDFLNYKATLKEEGLEFYGSIIKPKQDTSSFTFNIRDIQTKNRLMYTLPGYLFTENLQLGVEHSYVDGLNTIGILANTDSELDNFNLKSNSGFSVEAKIKPVYTLNTKLTFSDIYKTKLKITPSLAYSISTPKDMSIKAGLGLDYDKFNSNISYKFELIDSKLNKTSDILLKEHVNEEYFGRELSDDMNETGKIYSVGDLDSTELSFIKNVFLNRAIKINQLMSNKRILTETGNLAQFYETVKVDEIKKSEYKHKGELALSYKILDNMNISTNTSGEVLISNSHFNASIVPTATTQYSGDEYSFTNFLSKNILNYKIESKNKLDYKFDNGIYTDVEFNVEYVSENTKTKETISKYIKDETTGKEDEYGNTNYNLKKEGEDKSKDSDIVITKAVLSPKVRLGYKKEVYDNLTLDVNGYYMYANKQVDVNKDIDFVLVEKDKDGKYLDKNSTAIADPKALTEDDFPEYQGNKINHAVSILLDEIIAGNVKTREYKIRRFITHTHEVGGSAKLTYKISDTGVSVSGGVNMNYNTSKGFDVLGDLSLKYIW